MPPADSVLLCKSAELRDLEEYLARWTLGSVCMVEALVGVACAAAAGSQQAIALKQRCRVARCGAVTRHHLGTRAKRTQLPREALAIACHTAAARSKENTGRAACDQERRSTHPEATEASRESMRSVRERLEVISGRSCCRAAKTRRQARARCARLLLLSATPGTSGKRSPHRSDARPTRHVRALRAKAGVLQTQNTS